MHLEWRSFLLRFLNPTFLLTLIVSKLFIGVLPRTRPHLLLIGVIRWGKKAISKRSKPRSREGNTYVGHPERAKFYGALWVNCLCSIRQKIHKLGRRWIWCGGEHDRFKNWNCTSDCAMRTCWRPWRRSYLLELKCVRVIESLENKCLNHLLRSWWNNLSVITICQVQQIPTRIIAHRNDRTN